MLNVNFKFLWNSYMFTFKKTLSTDTSHLLSDLLGISKSETIKYVKKFKLDQKEPAMLEETVKYCQSLGFHNEDILKTKGLLTVGHLALRQHYWSMEEGGFQSMTPNTLARAIHYMRRKLSYLKSKNFINESVNVEKHFLSYIKDTEFVDKFKYHPGDLDSLPWFEVHFKILTAFLRYKLNATDDDLIKLFRIHRSIKYKSFRTIQKNIKIAQDLGFTSERILNYGYILNNYPDYTETVLSEMPTVAGADMRKAMFLYPKLILTSPKNIRKIYDILKKYHISDEAIQSQMNIFHMSPETIEMRLEAVSSSPDLQSLFQHHKFLTLIVHLNRTKTRLSFLQQLKLKCASLTILGTNKNLYFESYIREGKDINTRADIISLIKKCFPDYNSDILLEELQRHPFYLNVPLKDMDSTFQFLIKFNFKKSTIAKVIWIILYPSEKVKAAHYQLMYNPETKYKSLNEVCKLNMILYIIEKEHHFTGNGIWRNIENFTPGKTLE